MIRTGEMSRDNVGGFYRIRWVQGCERASSGEERRTEVGTIDTPVRKVGKASLAGRSSGESVELRSRLHGELVGRVFVSRRTTHDLRGLDCNETTEQDNGDGYEAP